MGVNTESAGGCHGQRIKKKKRRSIPRTYTENLKKRNDEDEYSEEEEEEEDLWSTSNREYGKFYLLDTTTGAWRITDPQDGHHHDYRHRPHEHAVVANYEVTETINGGGRIDSADYMGGKKKKKKQEEQLVSVRPPPQLPTTSASSTAAATCIPCKREFDALRNELEQCKAQLNVLLSTCTCSASLPIRRTALHHHHHHHHNSNAANAYMKRKPINPPPPPPSSTWTTPDHADHNIDVTIDDQYGSSPADIPTVLHATTGSAAVAVPASGTKKHDMKLPAHDHHQPAAAAADRDPHIRRQITISSNGKNTVIKSTNYNSKSTMNKIKKMSVPPTINQLNYMRTKCHPGFS